MFTVMTTSDPFLLTSISRNIWCGLLPPSRNGASRNGNSKNPVVNYINSPRLLGTRKDLSRPVVVFFLYLPLHSTSLSFLRCLLVDKGWGHWPDEKEKKEKGVLWLATHLGLHCPIHLVIESCTFFFQPNTKILTLLDIIGISRYISTI